MASLKDRHSKSVTTDPLAKPDWYQGTGEFDWSKLSDDDKQWALENRDDAIASYSDDVTDVVPVNITTVNDAQASEIDKWAQETAKVIDKPAYEQMDKAIMVKGEARRATLDFAKNVVIRLFGQDGRGKRGNEYALPRARTAEDIFNRPTPTKDDASKTKPVSKIGLVFQFSFAAHLQKEIEAIEAIKERTGEQVGLLASMRKERDDGKEYFMNAVALVQVMYIINQSKDAVIAFANDARTLRGPNPIIFSRKVVQEVNGRKEPMTDKVQFMSVESVLKFGTRVERNTQGVVTKEWPLIEGMTHEELIASRPLLKGRRKGGAGQGETGKNTEGLAFKEIENVNQFDGYIAEIATAVLNKDIMLKVVKRAHGADSDDFIQSINKIYRAFGIVVNNKDIRARLDAFADAEAKGQAEAEQAEAA